MRYIDPARKLHGHMDRLAQLRSGARPPPVNVEVDVSNRCNLRCHGCHFAHLHSRGPHAGELVAGYEATGDLMDDELLQQLPALLKAWDVRSVTWSGGGEPTMHNGFVAVLLATGVLMSQGLYTNGTLVNDGLAHAIKQSCTWVYVSMDYADPADYAQWKGVDAYGSAAAGVERLARATGNATVGVGFLLAAHNWRDAEKMLETARALGADYVQFRPMVITDPQMPGQLAEDTGWLGYFLASSLSAELAAKEDIYLDLRRFAAYGNWQGHGYDTCWWCSLQTVITPDGRAWLCANRRGQPAALLGHVTELVDTWQDVPAPVPVEKACRVMCRGHVPNLGLIEMLASGAHEEFI